MHRAQIFSPACHSPSPKSSCASFTPPLTVGPCRHRLPPRNSPESCEGITALPAPNDGHPRVPLFLFLLRVRHQPAGDHRRQRGPPEPGTLPPKSASAASPVSSHFGEKPATTPCPMNWTLDISTPIADRAPPRPPVHRQRTRRGDCIHAASPA
jgi:hypothetical protein